MSFTECAHRWIRDHLTDAEDHQLVQEKIVDPVSSPSPSPFSFHPSGLRLLTHNIWGLPIKPSCELRCRAFPQLFDDFDVVILQEAVHAREVQYLFKKGVEAGLIYQHQYIQGIGFPVWQDITAPGLLVLSRFPIVDVAYKRYSVNGKVHKFHHSDYMGAKGIGLVRIDISAHPAVKNAKNNNNNNNHPVHVDIFTTHIHANYTDFLCDANEAFSDHHEQNKLAFADEYLAHRVAQAYELGRFIAWFRNPNNLTVLAGDLNCSPNDIGIALISRLANLKDAFAECHPLSTGYTHNTPDNTWSPWYKRDQSSLTLRGKLRRLSGPLAPLGIDDEPCRIDYILYSLPHSHMNSNSNSNIQFTLADAKVVKQYMMLNGKKASVSDHMGMSAIFLINQNHQRSSSSSSSSSSALLSTPDSPSPSQRSPARSQSRPRPPSLSSSLSSYSNAYIVGVTSCVYYFEGDPDLSIDTSQPALQTAPDSPAVISNSGLSSSSLLSSSSSSSFRRSRSNSSKNNSHSSPSPMISTPSSPSYLDDDADLTPPDILKVLQTSRIIVHHGYRDAKQRRRRHWHRFWFAAIFILISKSFFLLDLHFSPLLPTIHSVQEPLVNALHAIYLHGIEAPLDHIGVFSLISLSYLHGLGWSFLSLLTQLCNIIIWWCDFALPAYAIFEFALAQFFVREEQTALAQILSEIDTHCNATILQRQRDADWRKSE